MEPNFSYIASSLTTMELFERIDNRQKYLPETIEAAVNELKFRKHEFSDEELKVIDEDIIALRANAAMVSNKLGFFNNEYKNVIIQDPDAPLLYSRLAIYSFAFLFGAMFGSVLMAMNLARLQKTKQAVWALLFGVGFSALQIAVLSSAKQGSSYLQVIGGLIAAYCLDLFFWKNYIGYATFYRARQIWVPLIIALVFLAVVIAAMVYGDKQLQ